MSSLNCEYIRDVYPDVLNGTLPEAQAFLVRRHIAWCAECRGEAALVDALRAAERPLPVGLHERIMAASRMRFSRVRRSGLAMAATLAAVMIGGALLQRDPPDQPQQQVRWNAAGLGFVGVEDAMLTGKGSIEDLSVEELEKLLGEIES